MKQTWRHPFGSKLAHTLFFLSSLPLLTSRGLGLTLPENRDRVRPLLHLWGEPAKADTVGGGGVHPGSYETPPSHSRGGRWYTFSDDKTPWDTTRPRDAATVVSYINDYTSIHSGKYMCIRHCIYTYICI